MTNIQAKKWVRENCRFAQVSDISMEDQSMEAEQASIDAQEADAQQLAMIQQLETQGLTYDQAIAQVQEKLSNPEYQTMIKDFRGSYDDLMKMLQGETTTTANPINPQATSPFKP